VLLLPPSAAPPYAPLLLAPGVPPEVPPLALPDELPPLPAANAAVENASATAAAIVANCCLLIIESP
jgi:hypothetical protein